MNLLIKNLILIVNLIESTGNTIDIIYFLASIAHPLGSFDTSSSDLSSTATITTVDEGYDASSIASASTVIHGACLTLSDHDRIHVFM